MKYKAPEGGLISGNQFYPGGSMLPLEATGQEPKKMAEKPDNSENGANLRGNPLVNRSFIFVGMQHHSAEESPKKMDAKNKVDAPEGPSAGVFGYGFSSPNKQPMGSMQFPDALQNLSSGEQAKHVNTIENVLMKNGIHPDRYKVYNSIGDWGQDVGSTGAEHSAVHVIKEPVDFDTLRETGAHIGHLKKQTSVLVFKPEAGGDSIIHRMYIPSGHSMDNIREGLRDAGIHHRTVVPAPDWAHVVFVVETPRFGVNEGTTERLKKIAKDFGGHDVDSAYGRASFVGEEGNPDDGSPWTFEQHSEPQYKKIMGRGKGRSARGIQMD